MGWWRTEWSVAARQDCQECSHARQYRNGPRFPAGTFPTVGSHREQLVFDNSFPPPRLSGEGSIHARTQTGTHGRSTTRRWPGGQGLCRCQKDARAAPLRSSRHFIAGTVPHLVSSNIYSPFPRSKEVEVWTRFLLQFWRPPSPLLTHEYVWPGGGGGAGCSLLF